MHGSDRPRIYLDNAATSWPKPPEVAAAIAGYYQHQGIAAGRGNYGRGENLVQEIRRLRHRLQAIVAADQDSEIVFTFNGTDGLNLAIQGFARAGDHVVTTQAEHNSVLRPLRQLEAEGRIELTVVDCDLSGWVDPDDIRTALRANTRLISTVHASNVTGRINPIEEFGKICREHQVHLLVDAAQSLGYLPIDVNQMSCDLLAASGHKGLRGPLGTGVAYLRESIHSAVRPLRFGGTGSESQRTLQPALAPERFESGNLNAGGLLGLLAAIESAGSPATQQSDWRITPLFAKFQRLLDGLRSIQGVRVFAPDRAQDMVPVVSFRIDGLDPRETALMLDSKWGIECRAGFHCAPLIAERLGVDKLGGTVRFSPSGFTTDDEIQSALNAVDQLAIACQIQA